MRHNPLRMDVRDRISALADLMQEYRLSEAQWDVEGVSVGFRKTSSRPVAVAAVPGTIAEFAEPAAHTYEEFDEEEDCDVDADCGTPVPSPMSGIFYGAPSPGSPAFVKIGDEISEGQVVGLIEAMKVFSEVPAPIAGTVTKIGFESGQLVQPGDPLLWIK